MKKINISEFFKLSIKLLQKTNQKITIEKVLLLPGAY